MPDKKAPEEGKKGAPEYMLTYGDMMTLLLCFFVLLLSMSTIDPAKFNVAADSFQNAFNGVLEDFPTVAIHQEVVAPRLGGDEQNKRHAVEVARQMREDIKKNDMDDAVKVEVTDNGIAIKISDPMGFDVGKAEIKPSFIKVLDEMIKVIDKVPGAEIRVEGHTDNSPISTLQFPSNWELSASRALKIIKYIHRVAGVDPARLSAVGYGEYRPIAPNNTEENKAKNRRIEMYIEYLEKHNNDYKPQ